VKPTVYYFTQSFPFGLGEQWKFVELSAIVRQGGRAVVIPLSFDGNNVARDIPSGVEVLGPILESEVPEARFAKLWRVFRSPRVFYFARELLVSRAVTKRQHFGAWLSASRQIDRVLDSAEVRSVLREAKSGDTLYFFWGRGACDIVPFVSKNLGVRSFVRMHGYDQFEAVNGGYIPYRRPLVRSATALFPVSSAGRDELQSRYPEAASKVRLTPLGATECGRASQSEDGVLRIVSCSFLRPVKRIGLLISALHLLRIPVAWTHVGDGPLMSEIREEAATLPANVTVEFNGRMRPQEIPAFYEARPIDVFLNVSESEGVPVSVQEAMSAGVPIIATDVGGTTDVVDASVGFLVPADVTPEELARLLTSFSALSAAERDVLRKSARERWESRCDANKLASELAGTLIRKAGQ